MPRPTGSQNRSTEQVRRAIAQLIEKGAPKLQGWLDTVAEGDEAKGIKPDPAKAADLMLKAAEYHIPKLARTESHVSVEEKSHEEWLRDLE